MNLKLLATFAVGVVAVSGCNSSTASSSGGSTGAASSSKATAATSAKSSSGARSTASTGEAGASTGEAGTASTGEAGAASSNASGSATTGSLAASSTVASTASASSGAGTSGATTASTTAARSSGSTTTVTGGTANSTATSGGGRGNGARSSSTASTRGASTNAASTNAAASSTTGRGATSSAAATSTTAAATAAASSSGSSGGGTGSFRGVLQRANDLAHDAVYVDPAFSKAVVSDGGTLKVDSSFAGPTLSYAVYAAPLYFVNTTLKKDLVIVVDEGNEVFALDATDGSDVWHRTPLVSAAQTNSGGTGMSCGNIGPPLGITGTPVIDPGTRTLFLDAVTLDSNNRGDHLIYALSLDDGSTVAGWPIDFSSLTTTLGNGSAYSFYSPDDNQRGALAFVGGVVYVPYGGLYGDCGNYHGAVIAIEESDPTHVTAFATTVHQAGIWSPGGIASDGTNLYVATGNGDSNQEGGGKDAGPANPANWQGGEGLLKLGPGATFSAATADYFAPGDFLNLDRGDTDLGSVAPVLFDFNDARTGLRHLIFDMGKTDNAYLVDRDNLGGVEGELSGPTVSSGWLFGTLAAYHTPSATYVTYNGGYSGPGKCPGGGNGNLIALKVNPSTDSTPITATVAWCAAENDNAAPLVSTTDGASDAMVWSVGGNNLYAYDGDTGAALAHVGVGSMQYWNTPIIAKGRLFMVASNKVIAVLP